MRDKSKHNSGRVIHAANAVRVHVLPSAKAAKRGRRVLMRAIDIVRLTVLIGMGGLYSCNAFATRIVTIRPPSRDASRSAEGITPTELRERMFDYHGKQITIAFMSRSDITQVDSGVYTTRLRDGRYQFAVYFDANAFDDIKGLPTRPQRVDPRADRADRGHWWFHREAVVDARRHVLLIGIQPDRDEKEATVGLYRVTITNRRGEKLVIRNVEIGAAASAEGISVLVEQQ